MTHPFVASTRMLYRDWYNHRNDARRDWVVLVEETLVVPTWVHQSPIPPVVEYNRSLWCCMVHLTIPERLWP